ncbi:MAG: ABC transporter permease [Woeseiaceae bacterium]
MKNIAFIGAKDVLFQLRQGSTVVWVFVMPPIFFYFIGTVTGGFSSGFVGQSTPITVVAENPGFLRDQVDLRLSENDFEANWIESLELLEGEAARTSTLTIDANMTDVVLADEQVAMAFDTSANALTREFEEIRIQRALYTTLADIVAADMNSEVALSAELLVILNEKPRAWQLDVSPAGERLEIPSGFEQAVPGILVMFTLLVLLTTSGSMLVQERTQGLLRRLASAPISRTEVITGKWAGGWCLRPSRSRSRCRSVPTCST